MKRIGKITEEFILGTADVIGLFQSIPYTESLEASRAKLEEEPSIKIPVDILPSRHRM